ncbi:MAG: type II toxin-antitoxin system HicA family toxin [Deltaproteobacteria bacterium]|nr:type II toxin-antitoxin system HicA family toxin [Deltaproteobacteria bacterium]
MKTKHRKTLAAIFAKPTRSNIKFSDIESLIKALGGEVREGAGSRVVLELSGTREYAHRPHPGKDAKKYAIEEIRDWLTGLGVMP